MSAHPSPPTRNLDARCPAPAYYRLFVFRVSGSIGDVRAVGDAGAGSERGAGLGGGAQAAARQPAAVERAKDQTSARQGIHMIRLLDLMLLLYL